MQYEFNFGTLGSAPPARAGKGSEVFRLAILGDFSARANRGEVAVGETLAARKPLRVDVDNLDAVLERLSIKLQLDIGGDDGTVEVEISSIDDFHPDELYDKLEIFGQLSGLRRRLTNSATFAKAAKDVQSWLGVAVPEKPKKRKPKPRGSVVAADCKLSDFARLVDRPAAEERESLPIDQLLRRVVGPHVVAAKDPRQDVLVAAVDAALSDTMRRVLHHPDFQATEALWRSVDMVIRRLETGANLKIVLYDVTAEEIAADLSSTTELEETGLYKLLVEQPALDAQQGAVSAIVGNYLFEQTPPHAELLGRMAKIAAAARAPFIAAISTECLQKVDPEDVPPLITESWSALRALPEAAYLALTVPRFMLRHPYGKRTDSIERFAFEEFTPEYGLRGMLWGNSAILAGLLLGLMFSKQGFKKMDLGSILTVGEMPFYYYTDADGDQVAFPCTERLLNERVAQHVTSQRFLPVLAIRGRPEVRLGGLLSLAGTRLAGAWAAAVPASAPAASAKAPSAAAEEPADSSGGDSDLDAILNSLDGDASSDAPSEAAESGDSDLDAILAGLSASEEKQEEAAGGEEVDADLAAMLAELGG